MSRSIVRRVVASAALVALLAAFPAGASATITGGCTGEGHSTSGGANLTTDTVWHLKKDDVAGGSGTAPSPMKSASVSAYALGIALPIAGGTSDDGETAGAVDGVQVSLYAILGARFTVGGGATGEGAPCSGQIQIILDDVDPLFTVLGGGGVLLAIIGLLAVLLLGRSEGGCMQRVLGGFFGALGGVGGALAAEQFDVLDPTEPFGLFVVIGAAILGFIIPGLFGGGGGEPGTPAAMTPAPAAPVPTAPMTPTDMGHTAEDIFNETQPQPTVGGSATGGGTDAPLGANAKPDPDVLPPGGVGGGGPM